MRSTYDSESNYRRYPGEIYPFFGPEIDQSMEFDEVQIECFPDGFVVGGAFVYHNGTKVSQVYGKYAQGSLVQINRYRYHRDDPEVAIVRERIRSGSCRVRFASLENGTREPPVLLTQDELHEANWLLDLLHPFHADDRDLFFDHITKDLGYSEPSGDTPRRFVFPGIIEGATRRYYRREDSPQAPDTNHGAATSLALLGWTPDVPYGGAYLHEIEVFDAPNAVSVSRPRRIHHRRKDQTAAIVALARAWDRYWRGLSSDFQNNPVRRTMRDHVEHAIGRMWADRPYGGDLPVFHEGESGSRDRAARDAEDWMLGNMEFWAYRWNFGALALALAEGSHRSLLDAQLTDYTFCHINLDGSVGDRLSNGADGITEATWDAYQDTHYPAALRHGVDTLTVGDLTVTVRRDESATAQIAPPGGLAPLTYALTGSEAWASIDVVTGLITVAPTAAVTLGDHSLVFSVTDDLGTSVMGTLTVTVQEMAP